jgi:hypothetical protein
MNYSTSTKRLQSSVSNLANTIEEIAFQIIIEKGISEKKQLLETFKSIPKDLRAKIQSFHQTKMPKVMCHDCENYFYKLSDINNAEGYYCQPWSDINNEEGYYCQPCVEFYDL